MCSYSICLFPVQPDLQSGCDEEGICNPQPATALINKLKEGVCVRTPPSFLRKEGTLFCTFDFVYKQGRRLYKHGPCLYKRRPCL